ncbi:dihydrofolate reductase family protein [Actinomadura sp. HBU206391]|uniref:dihydrofolate reductase family protein n=1 Tax=Actinomadura sp. HBU206391 TaxID=2731692 RepID=UPI00164F5C37|nr:dihydrofolate reductase family protein [Actinomadura sp. HBU206391]MBC6460976.1 dihydrofolate reductase family protein [Actinomadura sp. HBU206391]
MRRLLPEPAGEIDPYDAYGDVKGPWLRVGMVMSADGSVTDEHGWTHGLGGEADFWVFLILRALADGILVGAGTIRSGMVRPARLRRSLRERRGRPPAPIVVVSRSLSLDWTLPLFTAAETPTIVVTSAAALKTAEMPDAVRPHVLTAGDDDVDLGRAVHELRERGLENLVCEGGPMLATSLVEAGLVDEICLNLAPTLMGGGRHTRMLGELAGPAALDPAAVYLDDGVLFLRYGLT